MKNIIKNILLIEGRKEDVYTKYISKAQEGPTRDRLDSSYSTFVEGDPSGNHKYLGWMMKMMLEMILDRGPEYVTYHENGVVDVVTKFHTQAKRLSKKDINQYKSVKELSDSIDRLGLSKREEKLKGADKVFEDDTLLVVKPKTKEGSCYYGATTKWCTAAKNGNQFKNYSNTGTLYYIIWKLSMPEDMKHLQKVARYIKHGRDYGEDGEYYDATDNTHEIENLEGSLFHIRYIKDTVTYSGTRTIIPDVMKPLYASWESAKIKIDTDYAKDGMNKVSTNNYDEEEDDEGWDEDDLEDEDEDEDWG